MLAALLFQLPRKKREPGLRTLVWVLIAARLAHTLVGMAITLLGWDIPHLTPSTAAILTLTVGLALWVLRPRPIRRLCAGCWFC